MNASSNGRLGRPSKLNPERVQKIIAAIEAGNTLRASAEANGISYKTLKEWCARGRSEHPADVDYRTFRADVTRARAQAEVNAVRVVLRAAETNWSAASWWLERRNPRAWGRIDRVKAEVTAKAEAAVLVPREARDRFLSDPQVALQVAKLDALLARPRDEAPAQLDGPEGDE